jgi:hypothetical protein
LKTYRVLYWIVTGLLCLLMLASAGFEIFMFDESAKFVRDLGFPDFIAYVLPVTKILGVVAILTKKSKILKEWAYAGFFFDFVLAILAHYFSGVPSMIPAVVALVLMLVSYYFDKKIYG